MRQCSGAFDCPATVRKAAEDRRTPGRWRADAGPITLVVVLLVCVSAATARAGRPITTVYVGRHFEVRDHDQPVKYVFNGATRVARVTGSLSDNARVQRLRLHPGWNLVSLAVTADDLVGQFQQATSGQPSVLDTVYQSSSTNSYTPVASGGTVAAGTVLWIKANTNAVVGILGSYTEPLPREIRAGGSHVAAPGLELGSFDLPLTVTAWKYDAATHGWRAGLRGDLSSAADLPPYWAPGEAVYLHADAPAELTIPDPALRIAYYHQDHLGSSSVVTDATGALVEETAYYPFGATRHEERLRQVEAHYQFTQKERDRESGLHDFGHRYYHAGTARWLSPDPMAEKGGGLNLYSYVNQNPLKHHDPDGGEIKVARSIDRRTKTTTYQISLKAVFIDASSKKFTQKEVAAFAAKLKSTIEKSLSGKEGKTSWSAKVDLWAVDKWSQVEKDDHVFRIVDRTTTGAAGNAKVGGMLMDIAASSYTKPTPDQVDKTNPANKHYTWENYTSPEGTGTHEFVHTAGLDHDNSEPNLMQEGLVRKYDNKDVSLKQIEKIWKASENRELNKRDPILDELSRQQ